MSWSPESQSASSDADATPIAQVAWASSLGRAAADLRREVFVREQNVPADIELDDLDPAAVHWVALLAGEVVGTVRMVPHDATTVRVGRLAVRKDFRGQGIGTALMLEAVRRARGVERKRVLIHAQIAAAALYERLGFVAQGERFSEAGIEHVEMIYELS